MSSSPPPGTRSIPPARAAPAREAFLQDVIQGFSAAPKALPCKHFYDARGAALFEEICTLDEYYLTRAEVEIMRESAREMAARIGPRALMIEPGSGAGLKTRLLLHALIDPAGYIPIDISREQLHQTARSLARSFPSLAVHPLHGDFTTLSARSLDVILRKESSSAPAPRRHLIYFPGSTIGNFDRMSAISLLKRLAAMARPGGALLIGVDLKKDPRILEAAYNDSRGITAEFNLNLLHRINRELGASIDPESFEHRAIYDQVHGRIEMRLISRRDQTIHIAGHAFAFQKGEWIHTESSHKHTPAEFRSMLRSSAWHPCAQWLDAASQFAVFLAER